MGEPGKSIEQDLTLHIPGSPANASPPVDSRGPQPVAAKACRPQIGINVSEKAQRRSHHPEVFNRLQLRPGSVSNGSNTFEEMEMPGALESQSQVSLPVSTDDERKPFLGGIRNHFLRACASSPALPRHSTIQIYGPDDFEQFRSNLQVLVELETPDASLLADAEPGAHEGAKYQPFVPKVGEEQAANTNGFMPYPGAPNRKPVPACYVPPALQAGFADGIPPKLRVAIDGTERVVDVADVESRQYSWPLVDFHEEIFLNAEPNLDTLQGRKPKHQEPRIPSLEFSAAGLAEELRAVLYPLQTGDKDEMEEKIVLQERAWMSPTLPLDSKAYEMEAAIPIQETQAVEVGSSSPVSPAARSPAPVTKTKDQPLRTMSPVSPISSTCESRRVSYHEYNWPRFSDAHEYEDPADEYSRRYRDRRRAIRREMRQEMEVELDREEVLKGKEVETRPRDISGR